MMRIPIRIMIIYVLMQVLWNNVMGTLSRGLDTKGILFTGRFRFFFMKL